MLKKYSNKELLQVKSKLEKITSTGGNCVQKTNLGICFEINNISIVAICSQSWDHFSGDRLFPIPGGSDAFLANNLWEGEQLKERLLLCEHIINCIDKKLNETLFDKIRNYFKG